jgi:multiple sugar transport system permease protein
MIGFTDFKGLGKTDYHYLADPFKNFQLILTNPSFKKALSNTVVIWLVNFIPQILLALLLTAWFTSHRHKIKGQGAFKVLFYMPNIITAATIALLFNSLFGFPIGPVNDFLQTFGLIDKPINFPVSKEVSKGVVAFIQFWMWYGYTMIVLISGVLGLNPELFEASEIDGATGAQTFFFVTLPNLRSIMLFTLVTSMIGGLNMFDIPKLYIYNGGPDQATLTTSVFIYNQAFSGSYLYNRAAAASMIMFLIIAVLSSVVFFLMRDKEAAKLHKMKKQQIKDYRKAQKLAGKVGA